MVILPCRSLSDFLPGKLKITLSKQDTSPTNPPTFVAPLSQLWEIEGLILKLRRISQPTRAILNQGWTPNNTMVNELINEMVEAGVHYGHQTRKWNPKMKPYLMKDKGGIYIINLEETVKCLDKASDFLGELASKGQKILFVGCKRQAQDAVAEAAEAIGQYYVNHRWLGGTLTNLATIRRSVERLKYLEDIEKSPDFKKMSKKELSALGRESEKLLRNLRGIRDMDKLPAAMVIVDSARETIAVAEARRLNIPVIAIVDTNADPTAVDYPVPGNDDATRSIRLLLQNLVDSIVVAKD